MKKTCNGCRAIDHDGRQGRCGLGYSIRMESRGFYSEPIPLEECPKPRTYTEFFKLLNDKEKAKE